MIWLLAMIGAFAGLLGWFICRTLGVDNDAGFLLCLYGMGVGAVAARMAVRRP